MIKKIPKGMIFAGCSFTHGYGLQYYHVEEHKKYSPDDYEIPTDNDYEWYGGAENFRRTYRFARQVAKRMGTWSVTRDGVSGNDLENIKFLKMAFQEIPLEDSMCKHKFNYSEISHVIIQTSYVDRCVPFYKEEIYDKLLLDINKSNDIPEVEHIVIDFLVHKLTELYRDYAKHLESKGIKVYFLHITEDFKEKFEEDYFLKERTIPMINNGVEYFGIDDMMNNDSNAKRIIDDKDYFEEPIEDFHPSLGTHIIIANSIIKKIDI